MEYCKFIDTLGGLGAKGTNSRATGNIGTDNKGREAKHKTTRYAERGKGEKQ